jgi:hypothetical protein
VKYSKRNRTGSMSSSVPDSHATSLDLGQGIAMLLLHLRFLNCAVASASITPTPRRILILKNVDPRSSFRFDTTPGLLTSGAKCCVPALGGLKHHDGYPGRLDVTPYGVTSPVTFSVPPLKVVHDFHGSTSSRSLRRSQCRRKHFRMHPGTRALREMLFIYSHVQYVGQHSCRNDGRAAM